MISIEGSSVTFWLKVSPRSSRERLTRDPSGELRVHLHASPVDGKANEACMRYIARALGLPRSSVSIIAGEKSRRKLLRATGHAAQDIAAKLRLLATDQ